jgi:colanic acid biosynthesis glycosyl transferase WcaI
VRVLLVNQAGYPDHVATAQHSWDLAQALRAAGHEVTVLTSRSRYGSTRADFPPRESVDGVKLIRVRTGRFGARTPWSRIGDFLGFLAAACWKALTLPRQDVCVCLTTPPYLAVVGWLLRLLRGTPYVVWSMDLYPDVPVAHGMIPATGWMTTLLVRTDRWLLNGATRVVALGRCMRDRLLDKGVPAETLATIHIWPHQDELGVAAGVDYRADWLLGDRLMVMYAGNFGMVHDMAVLADAVIRLGHRPDIVFAFVGGGPGKAGLLERLRQADVRNWLAADYQPRANLGALLEAADLHLASLRPGFEGLVVPSKVLGAMAAGRPVVYVGRETGEAARVILEAQAGAVVAAGDGAALARCITRYADDREAARRDGLAAREAAVTRWSAARALREWVVLLEGVPTGSAQRAAAATAR